MEIQGHYQNGLIVPNDGTALPDGTEVTIKVTVPSHPATTNSEMTEQQRQHYLAALARIDAVPNESPGDAFSGADHDRILYGSP
jgi:hypothetical protein